MYKCSKVDRFESCLTNKGYMYFIVLENSISINVDHKVYNRIFKGDIISYYISSYSYSYKILRIFRKNRSNKYNAISQENLPHLY